MSASRASAGSNLSLRDVKPRLPPSPLTPLEICVPSICWVSESWSAVFEAVPSLSICAVNDATPSLPAGSKL